MGVLGIEVVARAVEIGGHDGEILGVVLPVVGRAHLDPGDLGHRIRAVGGLQGSGEQILLFDRLRAKLWVDAGRAEKQEPVDSSAIAGVDYVGLNDEVFADEVCRVGVVGENSADFGCREKHVFRTLPLEEAAHGVGVAQIQLAARWQQEPFKALAT